MLTRCPQCSATFRVTDAHLNAAQGKVRCGACMSIFNAREHLIAAETPASPRTTNKTTPSRPERQEPGFSSEQIPAPVKKASDSSSDALTTAATSAATIASRTPEPDTEPSREPETEPDPHDEEMPLPADPDDFSDDDLVAELEAVLQSQEMPAPEREQHPAPLQEEETEDDLHALIADEEPQQHVQGTDRDSELDDGFPNFDEHELSDAEAELDAILAQAEADEEVRSRSRQEETSLTEDFDDDEEFLFQDNPEEDKAEGHYHTGKLISDEELSDSFRELNAKGPGSRQFGETLAETDEEEQPSDESWAEEMLEELQDEGRPLIAPTPEPTRALVADEKLPEAQPAPEPEPLRVAPVAYDRLTYDPIAVDETDSGDKSLLRTLGWILLNAILLVALLAQLAWFHYDKLARDDRLRPIYQTVCDWAGCTLPPLQDVSQIKSRNLVVRSHPTNNRALVIDVMMFNQASFAQPLPDLSFQFSDLNGKVIAQRVFAPREYLSGEARNLELIPPETPIHISLEIIDPGETAVNYRMDFLPRATRDS